MVKAVFWVNRWYSRKAMVAVKYKTATPPPVIMEEKHGNFSEKMSGYNDSCSVQKPIPALAASPIQFYQ